MKKKAKRVKVKVTPIAPDKHVVELEIEGAETPPLLPVVPLEIAEPELKKHPLVQWLKKWL